MNEKRDERHVSEKLERQPLERAPQRDGQHRSRHPRLRGGDERPAAKKSGSPRDRTLRALHSQLGNRRVAELTRQNQAGREGKLAEAGVADASQPVPFLEQIQRSFGRFDVSSLKTSVGGQAAESNEALGSKAYATQGRVGFREAPDLHTAAHEAAHVVQQNSGVSFAGRSKSGDAALERHADRVADAVVSGRSAEAILGEHGSPSQRTAPGASVVQKKSDDKHRFIKRDESETQRTAPPPKTSDAEIGKHYSGRLRNGDPQRTLTYHKSTYENGQLTKRERTSEKLLAIIKRMREDGKKRGLEAKEKHKDKPEGERQKQMIIAVIQAIRPTLNDLNNSGEHPGCQFTTKLLVTICRDELGIPAETYITQSPNPDRGGHTLPFFPKAGDKGLGLKHGDDAYTGHQYPKPHRGVDPNTIDANKLLLNKDQINKHHNEEEKILDDIERRLDASLKKNLEPFSASDLQRLLAPLNDAETIALGSAKRRGGNTPPQSAGHHTVRIELRSVLQEPNFKLHLVVTPDKRLRPKVLGKLQLEFRRYAALLSRVGAGNEPAPKGLKPLQDAAAVRRAIAERLNKAAMNKLREVDTDVKNATKDRFEELDRKTHGDPKREPSRQQGRK